MVSNCRKSQVLGLKYWVLHGFIQQCYLKFDNWLNNDTAEMALLWVMGKSQIQHELQFDDSTKIANKMLVA